MSKVSRVALAMVAILMVTHFVGCLAPVSRQPVSRQPSVRNPEPPPPPPPKAPTATASVKEISRVTHGAAPEFWPRVSPDGRRLMFTTFDKTKVQPKRRITWQDLSSGLSIVMMKMGEPGRKLVAGPFANDGAWYPDGSKFIYRYSKMAKSLFVRTPVDGVGMTFVSSTALGDMDSQPDVSPDGKRIAFHTTGMGSSSSICTVDAGGGNFTVFVDGASPRWHPDGTRLAFDRRVGDKSDCFVFDLSSGQVTQLTTEPAEDTFPVWSPDGQWIAFCSDRDGNSHLFVMKADGSHVSQLTRGDTLESQPHWSSDGYIYFACNAGAPEETKGGHWFLNYANIWRLKPALPE